MSILILSLITFCFSLSVFLYFSFSLYPKYKFKKRIELLKANLKILEKKKYKAEAKENVKTKTTFNLYKSILNDIEISLEMTDIPLTPNEIVRVFIFITIFLSFIGLLGGLFISILIFFFCHVLLIIVLKTLKNKRKKKMLELIPDVLELMSNSLKTGYSFTQTVDIIRKEKLQPLSFEFNKLYQALALGESFDRSLQQFSDRVNLPGIQTITDALLITKETGGNISFVIDNLLVIIRENQQLMNESKTLTAQGKITGWIVGSMPLAMTVFLYLINPAYMHQLFVHPIGIALLIASVILQVIGISIIIKLIKIDLR